MLPHERERVLYRILSGKTILNDFGLVVFAPSLDLLYEGEEIYHEYYNKKHILTKEDIRLLALKRGTISKSDLSFLDTYEDKIKVLQVELYNEFYEEIKFKTITKELSRLRDRNNFILSELNKYETYSRENLAHYAKSMFLISKTTFKDGKIFDFNSKTSSIVLSELNKYNITNEDIREIARKSSWANTWFTLKGSNIFPNFPTIEQQLLIMWSKVYDNIRETEDCPLEAIIDNDDALDGWLILQKHKREKEQKNKKIKSFSKIQQADEVFILAKNKEEAERIQNMNSDHAKKSKTRKIKCDP